MNANKIAIFTSKQNDSSGIFTRRTSKASTISDVQARDESGLAAKDFGFSLRLRSDLEACLGLDLGRGRVDQTVFNVLWSGWWLIRRIPSIFGSLRLGVLKISSAWLVVFCRVQISSSADQTPGG